MNTKILTLSLICANALYAADISALSGSVSLKAGEQKEDSAVSKQGNGQASTFGSDKASFTLNGASNASYTLKAKDTTTTFYMGLITLNQNSQFALSNFHTIAFERGINVNANSTLSVISSGNTINAQFSDYGGASKVRFNQNATLSLQSGSRAKFSNADFFIHDGKIILLANSTLEVEASKGIRIQRTLESTNATIKLSGDVYNIGNKLFGFQTSSSTWTSNGSKIEINGDFYNGGNAKVDESGSVSGFNVFDPYYNGGGNLILNNTTMSVSGKFVSRASNDLSQESNVKIYGSTLSVTGGFENKEGSNLTFGVLNNTMGKLEGDLSNDKGKVFIDTDNIQFDTAYQIVTGSISGVTSIELLNPNSSFLNVICQNGSVTITQKTSSGGGGSCNGSSSGGSGGGGSSGGGNSGSGGGNSGGSSNQTALDEYKSSLNTQDQKLLSSLVNRFGGADKLLTSDLDVKETMKTINKSVEDNLITRPKTLLSAFKSDAMVAPLAQGFVSRPTASNDLIRFDNGSLVSGLDYSGKDFYANAFGGVLRADDTKGYLGGFNLGLSSFDENYLVQGQISYARGSSTQDLSTQSSKTTGDFIQLGFFSRIDFVPALELDLNLNAIAGFFSVQSDSFINPLLSSKSKFNTQELNGGFTLGYRFGERLSFKPFAGLEHYLIHQGGFKEEGGLGIESKAYTHYALGGVVGAETRLELDNSAFVFAKVSYEDKLYHSHKNIFFRVNDQSLKYKNESFDSSLQASIGAQIFAINNARLNAEMIYKHYDSGLNYYGGNLMLKYVF
ncbi:hypothetical protein DMB95_03220 [Campylobacter sp. MIT 12-8780]|uniref:autotransporter outer membrane beta-barrel domain-containing protein n=1 Tax=unclassified Campylobacter TaxID=2593542 RepID=UPI00115F5152|nr:MULTISPECIES: autotransporter outer membrane beta-barrel domain-containing protein [unclassified Campylobacter]NDJ26923.1 autotransporter outer membrane beta-barrel domain-containing protein [Campylobacter sp. MIT 19-121]TQR41933.1 hypothetical protein DMB95_03220 [Campylobacter sp. MIT 12-8780]